MDSLKTVALLFLLQVGNSLAHFIIGRVLPTEFDYADLNGIMRPSEAANVCENDPICAGFTYRGLRFHNVSLPETPYEILFFRFIASGINFDDDALFSNWVTYRVNRNFAEYNGYFPGEVFEKFSDNFTR